MRKQVLCLCQGSAVEQPWCELVPGSGFVFSAPWVSGCVPLGTRGTPRAKLLPGHWLT